LYKTPVGGTPGSYSHRSAGNFHMRMKHVCKPQKTGVKFGANDTIGCGVKANGRLFFTHNGKIIGEIGLKLISN
jgi:hypothetical protein